MSQSGDMVGRVVAVTGAARGIGCATAAAFVAAGARVALGDLTLELSEGAARRLGPAALGLELDVSSTDSFSEFLTAAEERLGPIDVLVNNAGVMLTARFIDERDADLDRTLSVNLRGVLLGSRLAAQRMVPRGHGTIVNVASQAGRFGFPGGVTYCATKWGVVGASEALDAELRGTGVSVRVIVPAVVQTDLTAGLSRGLLAPPSATPERAATAIVRSVRSRRFAHGVPRTTTSALSLMRVLPYRARSAVIRMSGAERFMLEPADPSARAAYLRRVEAGR